MKSRGTFETVTCLDDDVVSAYVARKLPEHDRASIEDHLSSCEQCLTIVCAAARSDDATPNTARKIGRYTVLDLLGEGAMGSVFVAHDPQLDRKVALKLVRSDRAAQAQMHARLAREARTMAQIRHPNVVTVYDAGVIDEGVFIAMELVDGETLRRWLMREKRSWQDIVRAFGQAGRGLDAAHDAGIVHRDFKPDNVLVATNGRVAVSDFGVAAMAEEDPAIADTLSSADPQAFADPLVTRTGALIGTPRYMSPEQFRGEHVDPRTDQFSFAVALYEALYGVPPFAVTSLAELAQIDSLPRPVPPASLAPTRISSALLRALDPDRAKRFSSMADMLDEIEAPLRKRSRAPIYAGAAAVVAAAVVGVVALGVKHESPRPAITQPVATVMPRTGRTKLLVAPFENQTKEPSLDGTLDVIAGELASASVRYDVIAGPDLEGFAARVSAEPKDVDAIAKKLAQPVATVHGTITSTGRTFAVSVDVREGDKQRYAGTESFASLEGARGAMAKLVSQTLVALGDEELDESARTVMSTSLPAVQAWVTAQRAAMRGEQDAALAGYKRALELDAGLVEARAGLGLTMYNLGDRAAAVTELERAVQTAEKLPERKRLTLLGDYYGTVGRYSESIAAYQQLLAKWPGDGRTQINLIATAIDGDMWPLALEVAKRAAHDNGSYEIVQRNLIIAEVGNGHFEDAIRDGSAIQNPSLESLATLFVAYALVGRTADARATIEKLPADARPSAVADYAAYEGRLDDVEASGAKEPVIFASVKLRRGDKAGALASAHEAMENTSQPTAYLAARIAIEAGDTKGADAKAKAWSEMPESRNRMYGALLAGDLALAAKKPAVALASYRGAGRIADSWLAHERIARGALATGDAVLAERELHWCLDHRGQGALVSTPSLFLLPPVMLALAHTLDARHADEARAAYQALADLAPHAQHDSITKEALVHSK